MVKKLDANSYSTAMNGYKHKLAHKRSDKSKWNISDKTQRAPLIRILEAFIEELETEPVETFVNESRDIIAALKPAAEPAVKMPAKKKKAAAVAGEV